MPTTQGAFAGIMPIGDSVPCGVSTETESPTVTPSLVARSLPSTMPGRPLSEATAARRTRRSAWPSEVGDLRLERGIDPLQRDERLPPEACATPAQNRRRGADDVRHAQLVDLGVDVHDALRVRLQT